MNRVGRSVLALGCGLLALARAAAEEIASDRAPLPLRPSALQGRKLEELTMTRDRPLFTLERRPQLPAEALPTIATPLHPAKPRPDFVLKGIISEGSATYVLLEDINSSESVVVRAGEKVGAWRVMVDTEHGVTLVGEGEDIKLQMFNEDAAISK